MDPAIPEFWRMSLVGFQSIAPPIVLLALWASIRRSRIPADQKLATGVTAALVFLGWFFTALWFSRSGAFVTGRDEAPLVQFALFTPIIGLLLLLLLTGRGQEIVLAVPQQWLIGAQIYRSLGAVFLVLWAGGRLPGEFGLPAGIGDIIVGVAAPLVAVIYAKGIRGAIALARAWNVFGILDLIVAVTMGFLTAPSLMQMLAIDRPNELITAYPLVMIPAFLVPLSIILHVLSLWKLSRQSD
jgi:hypothetical protein